MFMPMTETRQTDASRAPARDEERWQAIKRRDPAFDGKFLFAVARPASFAARAAPRGRQNGKTSLSSRPGAAGREGGLPRLQALPARQARRARSASRGGEARVRADRSRPRSAQACRPRGQRGPEPLPLPSRLQGHHRRDPEGLCGRDAGAPRRGRAAHGGDGHGSDLRRGLQFLEPLLREHGRRASA